MSMTVVLLKTDEERIVQVLQETVDKLDSAEDEVVLDFTSVRRIGPASLRGMEDFASTAESKGVRVVLCGVSVSIYKVLKLVNLSSRFSFVN
jgi:anti-anti-sigma regulatory factor